MVTDRLTDPPELWPLWSWEVVPCTARLPHQWPFVSDHCLHLSGMTEPTQCPPVSTMHSITCHHVISLTMCQLQLFHDLLCPPISHHSVCSVTTANNLTPVMHDDWKVESVYDMHVPHRTYWRSQSWNKHISTQSGVYYALLHSQNTHSRPWKNVHILLDAIPAS